jgi:7,8-dihydroneopterin aldolase/epimerase/oxygenase
MSDRIFLTGMVFEGRHGVSDVERAEHQPIEVDLEVTLDLAAAGASDDLDQTVDYGALFETCRLVVEERSFRLLEGIAESIARDVLATHARVEAVTVRVTKPGVPIDGRLDAAGVGIERRRGSG